MPSSTLTDIQTQLSIYGYSISMILGTIGNVFIVILFSQQKQSACSIYLISSAIINSFYLIFVGFSQLFPFNFTNETTSAFVFCKLQNYVPAVTGQVAKTMIVFACLDRYVMTNDRANFRAFSTPKLARYAVFFSIIFWSLLCIHIAIMKTIINGVCNAFGLYSTFFTFFVLIIVGLIPPITSGVFGYLAYHNMRQLCNRVQPIAQSTDVVNAPLRRRDRQLLVIVISEVIVYIITSIPYPFITLETTISNYIISNKSAQYHQIEGFVFTIAYLLLFFNSAAPFYTYLVASKSLRQDFKQLIINNYRKIRRQQVNPTVHRTDRTLT